MEMKTISLILTFLLFLSTKSQICRPEMQLSETTCFNQLILFKFEDKYYRAGHFATNSKGDMIIEYSYNQYRLFYGLKKDGREYYSGGTKEIELTSETIPSEMIRRYESTNLFVALNNDLDKENEYLMSLSSWRTVGELFNIENDEYSLIESTNFFEHSDGTYSYIFQILEANYQNKNIYFCIYVTTTQETNTIAIIKIKRFELLNTNFEYNGATPIEESIIISRITSSIIFEKYNALALIYWSYDSQSIKLNLYSYDLNLLKESTSISEEISLVSGIGDGFFFKSCYLQYEYAAFVYCSYQRTLYFKVFSIIYPGYNIETKISFTDSETGVLPDITLNDFVKIDNERLALISVNDRYSSATNCLNVILFDLYDWYIGLKVRYYKFRGESDIISYFSKEISAHVFNGFLAFTATALPPQASSSDSFFSMFMLFGYPSGIDSEIADMYHYFTDSEGYDGANNIYNYLINTLKLENNIFGYEIVEQIKLISIPEEIKFLSSNDSLLANNDVFDANHKLYQTPEIEKNNDYYFLDYQFMVKEPDYGTFYNGQNIDRLKEEGTIDSSLFSPKTFYGRVNRLKFKLCNNNCQTCKVIGNSLMEQKCESCPVNSKFDSPQHSTNCKPNGYYIDYDTGTLVECTLDNSKFYIDENNNDAMICIKNTEDCPNEYPLYDDTTKECKKAPQENPSTILLDQNQPTTQGIIEQTTIGNIISPTQVNIDQTTNGNIISPTQGYIDQTTNRNIISQTQEEKEENTNNSSQIKHPIIFMEFNMTNMTNEDMIEKIDSEILANFQSGDSSIAIEGENSTMFLITTADSAMNMFNNYNLFGGMGLSIIDLGDCEKSLRDHYNIDPSLSLIIKQYEKLTISADRNVQYEVYHPMTKKKLNLSVCDEDTVDLYIPVQIDDKLANLYDDLKSSGYDLFNIDDPFYNDLCSPYKSENGTDVLLSDRKNDYYNNNYTTCQSNCQYSSFNSEYKFLKCECKVVVDDIDVKNINKLSKKIYKNFYDILKNSNYKTLKCYNLVFNAEKLKENIGSFVVISFFVGFTCFFAIYIIKGISPLQQEVIQTVSSKFKDVNIKNIEENIIEKNEKITKIPKDEKAGTKAKNDRRKSKSKNKRKSVKNVKFPPKKRKSVKIKSNPEGEEEHKKRRKSKKYKNSNTDNNIDTGKRKSRNDNRVSIAVDNKDIVTESKKDLIEDTEKNNNNKKKRKSKEILYNLEQVVTGRKMDDLDLNNLTYEKAVELDKRKLSEIYWSRLKSKHLLIFTFFSCNDHNLVYIKIARFLFLICTSLAMNVIFFFDSSMHKIYLDYGKYNFIQQIPQIIYSSLVSMIIEILIGILSYTDSKIYEIRQIEEYEPQKIKKILKTIKIKLAIFFIVTFLFFAFYWYLISSFCAVYGNTQIIYLKDVATSFCLGLVYPFGIQLGFALLRVCTLRDKKKSRSFLYKFC